MEDRGADAAQGILGIFGWGLSWWRESVGIEALRSNEVADFIGCFGGTSHIPIFRSGRSSSAIHSLTR
jgi:hypothetical protein